MKDFDFDFEVTLDPDVRKMWNEMCNDSESQKLIMDFYRELIVEYKTNANKCLALYYQSYKDGRLKEHFEKIDGLEREIAKKLA